jgi:pyruvate dehydrogenase E1 component beta subunit
MTYGGAVNAALRRALTSDPSTLVFGEDVAAPGGVFGVTKGLQREFGDRVFDTPISESAILGGAVGAAMFGRRPIVEIMWADFSLVALDQLVNQAANVRYVSRGRLTAPITVRTQQGSAPGACAQHSQSIEAMFAHVPGLQVCMPATHQDAYDLLLAAVRSDDPTIVIENRTLYHGLKADVRVDGPVQLVGGALHRRRGTDVTVVSWGAMLHRTLEAAERCAAQGIECDVIDARWLRPFDAATVISSLEATGRLVVAHEAHTVGGFGAEVVAAVAETGLPMRSAPIRVGTPDARIPAAPALMRELVPSADVIEQAIMCACTAPAPVS